MKSWILLNYWSFRYWLKPSNLSRIKATFYGARYPSNYNPTKMYPEGSREARAAQAWENPDEASVRAAQNRELHRAWLRGYNDCLEKVQLNKPFVHFDVEDQAVLNPFSWGVPLYPRYKPSK